MITRRSFLAALAAVPFVGKFIQKPPFYARGHQQYADSVFPLRWPVPGCQCAACRVHHQYLQGSIKDTKGFDYWYQEIDPRDAEFLSGDPWPEHVRAERIKAGLPTL